MNRNLALALMFAPAMAAAQGYPFSQRSSITQNVALTTISIEYGRPVARGRILWGKLVPWDSVWHPGADSATRISINHDIQVAGALGDNAPISFKTLKAGEYSLWLIPREKAPWTVIFSSAAHTFHKPYPGDSLAVLRIDVRPQTLSFMESFAIYFPEVLREDAEMRLHWGPTGLTLKIKAPYKPD